MWTYLFLLCSAWAEFSQMECYGSGKQTKYFLYTFNSVQSGSLEVILQLNGPLDAKCLRTSGIGYWTNFEIGPLNTKNNKQFRCFCYWKFLFFLFHSTQPGPLLPFIYIQVNYRSKTRYLQRYFEKLFLTKPQYSSNIKK